MKGSRGKNSRGMVLILAGIDEMSAGEVQDRIGESRYQAIRGRDRHPMFVELLAGHEGYSTGKLGAGTGRKRPARKKWARERMSELVTRLRDGVPVFPCHSQTGKPRRPVGEIICAAERWVKGMLGATGIAYISDPAIKQKIRSGELDTCSIEAEVECHRETQTQDDAWMVDAVRTVTGIALGNSRLHKPGFPGAALLAAVEEFEDINPENPGRRNSPDARPSEIFDREMLLDDPVVTQMISDCRERDAQRIQDLAMRLEAKDKKIRELSGDLERHKAGEKKRTQAVLSEEVARKILADRNATAEERRIVLDEVRKMPPTDEGLEKEVVARVERELEKMDRLKKLWSKERIATPPEIADPGNPAGHNPLIPGPREW
jgi:hypothetical protein